MSTVEGQEGHGNDLINISNHVQQLCDQQQREEVSYERIVANQPVGTQVSAVGGIEDWKKSHPLSWA